jgi:uncharacterized protein YggE
MRIVMIAVATLLALTPGLASSEERQIVVQGEGRVSAAPDTAIIALGVQREARDARTAMRDASEAMTLVLSRLDQAGIAPEDIQTTRVGLDPRWQHSQDGAPPRVTGYVASNDLSVRVRDLDALGGLLDAVVSEGANTMNGLSFSVADMEPLEDAARIAAVEDARRKAATLADAAGVTLGGVVTLSEGGVGGPVPMMETAMLSDRAMVPVAAGQVDVVVTVRAVFAIAE